MASNFWEGDFYFNNVHSSMYKVCIIDVNSSEILKQIGNTFQISLNKDISYKGSPLYLEQEKTSDNITLQLCRTDGEPWTATDLIGLNSWLFQKNFKKFQPLDFINQGYNFIYYLKAIEMRKYLNTNMEGYVEIVFQPYDAYVYAIPTEVLTLANGETKNISSLSNVQDKYFPKIRVVNSGNESNVITISNLTNGQSLTLSNMKSRETVIIDCAIGSVVDTLGVNRFEILQNYDFIGLEKGNNDIKVTNNCSIEFVCEFPIIF